MPIRWNVPQHAAALERLDVSLGDASATGGAVVLGPDGVGKSTLARLAAEEFCRRHPTTLIRWVIGTPTERGVPFGAFGHLVNIAELGKPAALLRAARGSLSGDDQQRNLLLIVDDAHNLDILSTTLVYQLALTGTARMIVTARGAGVTAAPEAITALWTDGLLDRIDIEPPGGATEPAEVDEFIAELPAAARSVLDYLAIAEPLSLAALTYLAGDGAVQQAEELGAVETRVLGGHAEDPVVYTAHPLFAERARAALGHDGARRLRTDIVALLSRRPTEHLSDRLRLASLALDSEAAQPVTEVVDAAQQALRLGDVRLAERLARAALDRQAGLDARLVLAQALSWQGRGREAAAVLAAVDPDGLSEAELRAWAVPRAANQFWMLGEPERATAFLQTTRNRITEPTAQAELDALTATFAMNAGNLPRAITLAGKVLSQPSPGDTAVAWAASAAALSSARMGRFRDVEPLAQRASAAEHPGLLRFTVGLAQITSLLMAGDIARAQALAQQFTDFAELQQPGRAIGEVLLGHVLLTKGEFGAAASLLEPAAAALERSGYSWGPLSLMLLATAIAQQGRIAESAKALRRAETRHGTKSALFAPELMLARAWTKAAARDKAGAIADAREAARTAERGGQSTVALRAWHDAVRLGDIRAVVPVTRLAAEINCPVGDLVAKQARALADGDAAALTAVAEELAAIGMAAAASDAAAAAVASQSGSV
ncbi:AAA family ATPase [Mycobacterium persicum]|uniref:AAA family ATPase n=1 Tax=Mycobacterium persicum TaxID=1487726 RepID=A0A8E2ISB5_9MYCO|nr:AAA family ATPase [Mycobacterium persicum]KZS85760.1 AAA family ATPase [Mycobacterium persicum]ORB36045.1 AAA family ATPase [Mycobacterium persicum]ORB94350.1 AAA family ATPase [Mycobacterium persicum]ORC01035.1 AAA family ATPase [Mycobacterium persicum]ORC06436.1 AAA family ATPase [Mycobacterium persicum]